MTGAVNDDMSHMRHIFPIGKGVPGLRWSEFRIIISFPIFIRRTFNNLMLSRFTMLTCGECLSGMQAAAQVGRDGKWYCSWDRKTVFAAFSIAARTCFFCHVVIRGLRSRAGAPSDDSLDCEVALRYVFRQCDEDVDVAWLTITISHLQKSFRTLFLVADTRHEGELVHR